MKYTSEIIWYLFWILSIVGSYYASLFGIKYFEKKWNSPVEEVAEETVDKA